MAHPQGVPHLVDRELPYPGEGHLQHLRGLRAVLVVGHEPLSDHEVMPDAEGAQGDLAFDDLACPWVCDASAVAPAPGGAVHPVDDVVPDVKVVGPLGEHLAPERVLVPRCLEGLVPPRRAIHQRRPDGFRDAPVHVVDYGLHGLPVLLLRVLLLQPVAPDELLLNGLVHRGGVVIVYVSPEHRPRIPEPGLEAVVGQLDEAVVLPHGEELGLHGDAADVPPGALPLVGQQGLELGVEGKVLGLGHPDGRL